jgi:hypothetical protein
MRTHASQPSYDRLLQEWQFRRETVDSYHRALRFLALDSRDATQRQREMWRDLIEKLSIALIALGQASDQLHSYEQARELASRVQ